MTDLRLSICKEPFPNREAQREWRDGVLLPAERPLAGTCVGVPVCKDLVCILGDRVRTCPSSSFDDGRWVTRSSHLNQRRAVGKYSPPMLVEDTALRGEYDGIDTLKEMGKGAIHPSERPGGFREHARANGGKGAADGLLLPR